MKSKVQELLDNLDQYYNSFLEFIPSDGPQLYFHLRLMNSKIDKLTLSYVELLYAALATIIGLRVGRSNVKLVDFDSFHRSISQNWEQIQELSSLSILNLKEEEKLLQLFENLVISNSKETVISNSLLLSLMLPNLVPPIDRKFTINHVYDFGIPNNLSSSDTFRDLMFNFYKPLTESPKLIEFYNKYKSSSIWNTCLLKFIDNLIIGAVVRKYRMEGKLKSKIEPIREMIFIAPF